MDALIKGNDLNKLKERVMLNKLNEGEWLKQTKGNEDVLNKFKLMWIKNKVLEDQEIDNAT